MQKSGGDLRNPNTGLLSKVFKKENFPYLDDIYSRDDCCHRDSVRPTELSLLKTYYEKARLGEDHKSFSDIFMKFPHRNIFIIAPCGAGKSCFLHWCMKVEFEKSKKIKWGIINLIKTGMKTSDVPDADKSKDKLSKADITDAVHKQLDDILTSYYPDLKLKY